MAVSGDVTIGQDGGQNNVKLHPYIAALVRWCVSCLWSTATVLLHRLMLVPLQPIAASKPQWKPRPAGTEHLHPEPRVECVLLHRPAAPKLDVIFIHGLYGSLGNTWRQGDWRSKYKMGPNRVPLKRSASIPTPCDCHRCENKDEQINKDIYDDTDETKEKTFNFDEGYEFTNIDEKFYKGIKKILPNNEMNIAEKFYNNTLLDQVEVVDNYDKQAKFLSDLFKCDNTCDNDIKNGDENDRLNEIVNDKAKVNKVNCICNIDGGCEVGCGCVCDACYSPCWPKDWIKVDYPDARVISVNYTSDPHLWRPLWVKENKRLRLHERAEQMTQQLLDLGVGERPIVWVGHSKGGLFIKQIYCDAYEAYLKTNKDMNANELNKYRVPNGNVEQNCGEYRKDNEINRYRRSEYNIINSNGIASEIVGGVEVNGNHLSSIKVDKVIDIGNDNSDGNGNLEVVDYVNIDRNNFNNGIEGKTAGVNDKDEVGSDCVSSLTEENKRYGLNKRAGLWTNSVGFMFYSVPHRGSPLADFKTPITARSIELLEISKDCPLVVSLQARWARALEAGGAAVRSLVETRRTLMSVLWLRIVSVDSADAGVGALCGVSVDHREICKPTSRKCLLYTELMNLIHAALNKCNCR